MKYYFLEPSGGTKDSACFMKFSNWEDSWELMEGFSLIESEDTPNPLVTQMNSDRNFPVGNQIQGILSLSDLTVDEKIKDFLSELDDTLEFLPVEILDKKGTRINQTYFAVNVLHIVECINEQETRFEVHPIDEDRYDKVENLTIYWSSVPNVPLFRIKHLQNKLVAREDVFRFFLEQGISDCKVGDIDGWSEMKHFTFLQEKSF